MFRCENCGGSLVYDIRGQKMKCLHCGTSRPVKEYRNANDADVRKNISGTKTYACPMCGAELIAPEASAVSYCLWCGSELILQKKMTDTERPQYIIPFGRTKQDAREAFVRHMRTMPFVPAEFRREEFLEKFCGIYIPYRLYDVSYPKETEIPALRSYARGRNVYRETWEISLALQGKTENIALASSDALDDAIAGEIAPFLPEDIKSFNEEYLAGFCADIPDAEEQGARAKRISADNVLERAQEQMKEGITLDPDQPGKARSALRGSVSGVRLALFPIWFLTWRNHERTAYAAVNGQTGKVFFRAPADPGKMALFALMLSVPLYFLLDHTVSLTADSALPVFTSLGAAVSVLAAGQMLRIHDAALHLAEHGYGNAVMKNEVSASGGQRITALVLCAFAAFWCGCLRLSYPLMSGLMVLIEAVSFHQTLLCADNIGKRRLCFPALCLLVSGIAAFVLCLVKPQSDLWYYTGCIAVLLAAVYAAFRLSIDWNLLSTWPMPSFTDRKGGDDSAEDQ